MLETDVLIVGSGPAGSAAALMLSRYGVRSLVVTKYRWLADSPRAHYVSQRTMEVMQDLGIEQEVRAKAAPKEVMGDVVFCTAVTGDEIGRLPYGMNNPHRASDYLLASPCEQCDLPQHLFEPILLSNAASQGSHVRFDTEYLSHVQDAEGVTAIVRDRLTGSEYPIRCRYLIGADGAASRVAADLALPMAGEMGKSGSMSIIFDADLSKYIAHRPGYLWWVIQPGANIGGIGLGLLRMVRPWNEWQIVWGYDITQPPPELTPDDAAAICRQLIGDPDLAITVRSTSLWTVNEMYATEYGRGRVFCMGDAVHRHPPSNGLGSNTSIQDAYNLCWKLAHVLQGKAGAALLDSYSQERVPVGERIVRRANQSVKDFGAIFAALKLDGKYSTADMQSGIDSLRLATAGAAQTRSDLRAAIQFKSYEFAALGVETNICYRSSAVAEIPPPAASEDDADLHYHPSCLPGHKLPHAWLVQNGTRCSTLHLVGNGRFTLLCGQQGDAWVQAAARLNAATGLEMVTVQIGHGKAVQDLYGELPRLGFDGERGCLLVRPDGVIAWAGSDPQQADSALRHAVSTLLASA